ncbi:DUF86 domain-containing protein [uncultured Halomonas sp.]|uniref:type VII toxin-antitoxin system HepT family RNase toxin n=1 Tax=uncultured Halomonas sp. TaxID=173971 RepID=UPI0026066ECC|nr:DUF86 domain-containing protein [uncultured Halomonas sp.]
MRFDLYLAETRQLAARQSAVLDQAAALLDRGHILSALEENGVLHSLQVLTENAIGKAKHILKAMGEPVPVSAYDAFKTLSILGQVDASDLPTWNAVIGLRNRIVHDYLNLDIEIVLALVAERKHHFIRDYLMADISDS